METKKRSYSPTIDDIRQFNIKRFKLLDDLSNLSLSQPKVGPNNLDIDIDRPNHVEYIPNIEEYLVNNQSDQDILESTDEFLMDTGNTVNIPDNMELMDTGFLQWMKQKKAELILANGDKDVDRLGIDYKEMLKEYYYRRNGYELVKYQDSEELVRSVWEKWYLQEFKLRQFDNEFMNYNDDDDEMEIDMQGIDVHYDSQDKRVPIKNTYGGYYNNVSSETSQEMMDLD